MKIINTGLLSLLLLLTFSSSCFSQNWYNTINSNTSTVFNDVTFSDPYTGFMVRAPQSIGSCSSGYLFKTVDAGANWYKIAIPVTDELKKIFFLNSTTGWAVGNTGKIIKTTDRGNTWVAQNSGLTSNTFTDISFFDSNNGFVTGGGGIRKTINGGTTWSATTNPGSLVALSMLSANTVVGITTSNIYRTTNGGTSWTSITLPANSASFSAIQFTDANNGYIIGSNYLLRTTNGGTSWTSQVISATSTLKDLSFSDLSNGYICATDGNVLRTSNGGATWISSATGFSDVLNSISAINATTVIACGAMGTFYKTTDGTNWKNIHTTIFELRAVSTTHPKIAYAAGQSGMIVKTTNAGNTWARKISNISTDFSAIRFSSPDTGWAAGANGVILKSIDAGETWTAQNSGVTSFINELFPVNSLLVYAAGNAGTFLKTTDGGANWISLGTGSTANHGSLYFVNKDTGYVVESTKILKTTNGGTSWTSITVSPNASSLNAISFANDSLGLASGTFGSTIITTNRGITWTPIGPNSPGPGTNALDYLDPDTVFAAQNTSPNHSNDSSKTWYGYGISCKISTGIISGLDMFNGNHGYSVGGVSGSGMIYRFGGINQIFDITTKGSTFCNGEITDISFNAYQYFGGANVFTAQLSDASGSFASPVNIGTLTNYLAGIIPITIPSGTPLGNGYRIRIVSSAPSVLISEDNGYDITIASTFTASVSISESVNNICAGTNVTFTATPTYGGSNPSYQWKVGSSNVGTNSPTFSSTTLNNNDVVTVVMTSNASCVSPTVVTRNGITMSVTSTSVPSVSIIRSANPICTGTNVTFTATPVNGGTSPSYQWKIGTTDVGTNSDSYSTTTLANGNIVKVVMTTNVNCPSTPTATSNSFTMTVNPNVTPSVSVNPSSTNICMGSTVNFTAIPGSGGTAPSYQWYVNSNPVGTNSASFSSSSLGNNNTVSVIMTSNAPCITTATATSPDITMSVNSSLIPSVTINTSTTNICSGTNTNFIASPTNEGSSPTYQWKVGSTIVGNNTSSFSSTTLADNDIVTVALTSSEPCASPATTNSNGITMSVTPTVTPSVSITPSATTICTGTNVTFTANPVNEGSSPSYQWKIGTMPVGSDADTYSSNTLANGNVVTVILTSNAPCLSTANATSAGSAITVNTIPAQPDPFTFSTSGVVQGTNGVVYTVPNQAGITYDWSYTGLGVTINNGSSNSVTLDFSSSATSGDLSVGASNSCGSSTSKRTMSITAIPFGTETKSMEAMGFSMSTSPNPFGEEARLLVSLPYETTGTILLLDIKGTELFSFVNNQKLSKGDHEFLYPSSLPAGIYIVKLSTPDGMYRIKSFKVE